MKLPTGKRLIDRLEVMLMKKIKIARSGYIIISIIFYVAAIVYLLFPNLSPMALCCFGGTILIVYGVIKLVGFFSEDLYCLAFRYDLAFGLLIMVIGVLLLIKNVSVEQYLTPGLGWIALLDNLFHIQMAKEARDFGLETWKLILGLSIAAGVLSVLLIIHGFPGPLATRILTCIVLLAAGAINHCIVMLTVRLPHPPASQETKAE